MAGLGTVTPRAKRPRRDSSGDRGLSATRAGARQVTRSQQRERDRGQHYRLRGWDPQDSVPCSPWVPVTPGKGRLAKLRLQRGCHSLGSAPPCLGGCGECVPPTPGTITAWGKGGGGALGCAEGTPCPTEPITPPLQPQVYFSGLPADECQDPAVPSLLVPTVPVLGRDVPRRTRSTPGCTLVLELEGTLLCSSLLANQCQDAAATVTTVFQRDAYEVRVKLRPHVQQFLESLSKTYEIVIFTTAKQDYAKKVLDVLDPKKKLIRHCLSQQDCLCACGCYWKDLTCLGRDLAKTVALDHTIQGVTTQAANWILVPRWWGDPRDKELLRLIPVLEQLGHADDVRPEIQRHFSHCRLPTRD
ncbi:CTD small phosphatase-like protein 2 [Patagioenas fasciata]|uniref:CTD small phosphatase-like protein 2 n=1 Tax=Patagioenas fasciata TaxID=372321 RepID=UPI003A9A0948